MPARSSAIYTWVIAPGGCDFISARYSAGLCGVSFVRKGITRSVLRVDVGRAGMPNAVQKSSARRPDRYPCLVIGADSWSFTFDLFLSGGASGVRRTSSYVGFDRQMNVGVGDFSGRGCGAMEVLGECLPGDWSLGKLMSSGSKFITSSVASSVPGSSGGVGREKCRPSSGCVVSPGGMPAGDVRFGGEAVMSWLDGVSVANGVGGTPLAPSEMLASCFSVLHFSGGRG